MEYVAYFLLIAIVFGLVALVDFLLKKLLRRPVGKAVRLPRYSFILGILLSVLPVFALLYLPLDREPYLKGGLAVVLVIGLFLLANFFSTAVVYDETGFTYRTLLTKSKSYRYSDITAQRSFLARSGIHVSLYANGDEIQLYQAMQGLDSFLHTAFFAWCRERGIDPDTVDYDPRVFRYFPELPEA